MKRSFKDILPIHTFIYLISHVFKFLYIIMVIKLFARKFGKFVLCLAYHSLEGGSEKDIEEKFVTPLAE